MVSAENSMATMNAPAKLTQIRVTRRSPADWRVTLDNPAINVTGADVADGTRSKPSLLAMTRKETWK
jgi:hypothetical protein